MNHTMWKGNLAKLLSAVLLSVLCLSAPLSVLQVKAAGSIENRNLLTNPGGEDGDLSGWTDAAEEESGDGTFSVIPEYVWGGSTIEPYEGGYFFFAGVTSGNYIYQDVDISDYPAGSRFTLSGYMNGWETDHGDNSYLEMDFMDRRGRSLISDSVCEPSIAGWDLYKLVMEKPEGAETVRVSLIAERNTGSDCDSYFDGISLTAEVPEAEEEKEERSAGDEQGTPVEEVLWTNFNTAAVHNGAPVSITLNVEDEVRITSITTYHWNGGKGEEPGSISIWTGGEQVGSWEASARSGSGADNVLWDVYPDIVLKAGRAYDFVDSSPATWSCNSGSDNDGFMEVRGWFTSDEEADAYYIGEPNYALSYGTGTSPTSYVNPVYISCDAETGELLVAYTNEKDHFGSLDQEDPDEYDRLQKTALYEKTRSGRWRKVSRVTTKITGTYDARTDEGNYGTVRLQFCSRDKAFAFTGSEYAVSFDIYTNGHHMTPEDEDLFLIEDAPEIRPAEKEPEDEEENGTEGSEDEAGGPASYAVSGGSFETLQSGEKVYYKADGSEARNEWVEEGGKYYFIDHSGCLMRDCYTSDGYWVAGDGSWMQSVPQRTDDPEPLADVKYADDSGTVWTFDFIRYADGKHYCIATKAYSFGYEETFDMTPIGHGGYLLEDEKNPGMYSQLSVSSDQKSIIVSGFGSSDDYVVQD
ncbi:MAG: hypothetical protein J6P87_07945 [Lachnospiraceae bacterium]|nr:hypothetical protein [Lachnospiraceae bacterium]